jgi:hypothetical protein
LYVRNCLDQSHSDWTVGYRDFKLGDQTWNRFEGSIKIGDVGVANGYYKLWRDSTQIADTGSAIIRSDTTCPKPNELPITFYYDDIDTPYDPPAPEADIYHGEIYVDITQARIELCSGATWANRQHCEIQIPRTTWTDSQIQFTVHLGSFTSTQGLYVFVVDGTGQASAGYALQGQQPGCTNNDQCNYLDNLPCVDGVCVSGQCQVSYPTPSCNDSNPCTTNDRCSQGVCAGQPQTQCISGDGCCPSGCTYSTDHDCTPSCTNNDQCNYLDNLPCVDGVCVNYQCQVSYTTNSCNDGNPCTISDRCSQGACSGLPQTQCLSGDGCCPSGCTYTNDNDCAAAPDLCSGLRTLLTFDSNAPPIPDETGDGNSATCSGDCPTFTSTGKFNGAYTYSSVSPGDKFTVANSPDVDPDNLTISVWFKRSGSQQPWAELLTKGWYVTSGSNPWSYAFEWESSSVLKWAVNDNTANFNAIPATISDGVWTNAVGTYTASSKVSRLYVNGVSVGTATLAGTRQKTTEALTLGHYGGGQTGGAFNGVIDEIAIWNRPLTSAEVTQLQSQSLLDLCSGSAEEYCDFNGEQVLYGTCSLTKPWYCNGGTMVQNCQACGCNAGQTCLTNGQCQTPAYCDFNGEHVLYGQCSQTKPWYCNGGTMVQNCQVCHCNTGYSCQSSGLCKRIKGNPH